MFCNLEEIFDWLSKENQQMIKNFIKKQDFYGNYLNKYDVEKIYNTAIQNVSFVISKTIVYLIYNKKIN